MHVLMPAVHAALRGQLVRVCYFLPQCGGPDTNVRSPGLAAITVLKELACQPVAALLRVNSHLQE